MKVISPMNSHDMLNGVLSTIVGMTTGSKFEKKCSMGCAYLQKRLNEKSLRNFNIFELTLLPVRTELRTHGASCGYVCRELLSAEFDENNKTKSRTARKGSSSTRQLR
jgi:hypothetical protein